MSIIVPRVTRTSDSADFFDLAREGRLLLRRCADCATIRGPQESFCPRCHAAEHEILPAAGSGTLVSWAVVHRSPVPDLEPDAPYVAAIVEVAEGPWVLVRLTSPEIDGLRAGRSVRIVVAPTTHEDGEPLVHATVT
jgi:uncharacterized OB-fold protein